jgi:hypothetical protein
MYKVGVASNGITFIPNFVKIGQMVQEVEMRGTYRQHGDIIVYFISFML